MGHGMTFIRTGLAALMIAAGAAGGAQAQSGLPEAASGKTVERASPV